MERRRHVVAIGLLVLVFGWTGSTVVASQSAAPSVDPVLGTWTLVVEKSIYDPGPVPRSQTRVYEAHPDGVKATIRTVDNAGGIATVEYVADYDSMEYPLIGTATADALALVRLDPLLAEGTVSHAGQPIAYVRRVISPDAHTMTITIRQTSGATNVAVYDRSK